MKKKVLVLGSTGMLGHQVYYYLKTFNEFAVHDISFRNKLSQDTQIIDATNNEAIESYIIKLKPDFIINCIGILLKGVHIQEKAIYLNAFLPHKLASITKDINSKLIHISTDCVFSGYKGNYIETDITDGYGIYAQTKILGEIVDNTNLTLRTSIVGPELKNDGEGLFHWFMKQSEPINGYTKAIWSGVTTLELAKAIKWSIDFDIKGLYHITNNTSINKFELLKLFKKHTHKDIDINTIDGEIVDKSFLDTKGDINYKIPSYEIMIKEMVEHMNDHASLYPYK